MPRLYRPHIPLSVRCEVAERQLRSMGYVSLSADGSDGKRLLFFRRLLADAFGGTSRDLRLDHDPPLAARPRRGLGKKTSYKPDANDPCHLFYRPHGPQFEGSHLIKTNVRGDHGQFPDRVLIKRERRRQKAKTGKKPVPNVYTNLGQRLGGKTANVPVKSKPKYRWPSRPLRSKRGRVSR